MKFLLLALEKLTSLPYPSRYFTMAEPLPDENLLDYDEEDAEPEQPANGSEVAEKKAVKGTYVSIHSSGFRDFLLKPELLRAIVDCGFEHPSEGTVPAIFLLTFF